MATPKIAHSKGSYKEIKAGQRYLWCSCGRSQSQPFCDGSHVDTDFMPVLFRAKTDEDVIFCGCKHTATPPFCDGAHNNLVGGSSSDDPFSTENLAVPMVAVRAGPVRRLDDACFVFSSARAELREHAGLRYCAVITPSGGARFQSQFYLEAAHGPSPVITAKDCHTVLFLVGGDGQIEIGGQLFTATQHSGVFIRPGEAYRLHNLGQAPLKVFISMGPGGEDLTFLENMPYGLEAISPTRLAEIDPDHRNGMGDRFYQLLINREHGSDVMTQFIGNIPHSKGAPHRHLYEEVLIFLHGEGVVWTETRKTPVRAGDVLFLPAKQLHSVQCVSEHGLDVVGVICPGDNPSINY